MLFLFPLLCTISVIAGTTTLSKNEMTEIGRLARAINAADCPSLLDPAPPLRLQPRSRSAPSRTHILASSKDRVDPEAMDMSWYISHSPLSDTFTLAFTSLPEPEQLIDLLVDAELQVGPLRSLPLAFDLNNLDSEPHIYPPYYTALEDHGVPAMIALLEILENMIQPGKVLPKLEIVGHGVGAANALLLSMGISDIIDGLQIETTLFGLPVIGDQAFADWVESKTTISVQAINSYKDIIPRFWPHPNLVQPDLEEIWITSDPRIAQRCGKEGCQMSGEASLNDHQGPYGGVWIGAETCQSKL